MSTTQPKSKDTPKSAGFRVFLDRLLNRFPERSQAIFALRFGLNTGTEQTLEEIGKTYAITRERVRQVVDVMLKKIRTELQTMQGETVLEQVKAALEEAAGVLTLDALTEKLAKRDTKEAKALLALLAVMPGITHLKESDHEKAAVALTHFDRKVWQGVIDSVAAALKSENNAMDFQGLYALFTQRGRHKQDEVSEATLRCWLAPSKKIEENVFGQYGLCSWETIRPRGTRERAHLILKVFGKPLHFREIAKLIDEHGLYKAGKKTHPQTVHNELIKDQRFVLVGRGTYALSDWGYERGTVRQVLTTILREKDEPMSREDLLKAVMKVRQVKKSTVIINLNTFFARVGKNIYTLREGV